MKEAGVSDFLPSKHNTGRMRNWNTLLTVKCLTNEALSHNIGKVVPFTHLQMILNSLVRIFRMLDASSSFDPSLQRNSLLK